MAGRIYKCNACGELFPRGQVASGSWGDPCCPACGSPDIERHTTRFQRLYAIFFLYKVY